MRYFLDPKQVAELRPCPFCAGQPFLWTLASRRHVTNDAMIECNACGIELLGDTDEQVTAHWNTRAPAVEAAQPVQRSLILVSGGAKNIANQLHACLPPEEIEELVDFLKDPFVVRLP